MQELTRNEFLARWLTQIPYGTRGTFVANLDALLEAVRAEERENVLSDGDAIREALKGSRW